MRNIHIHTYIHMYVHVHERVSKTEVQPLETTWLTWLTLTITDREGNFGSRPYNGAGYGRRRQATPALYQYLLSLRRIRQVSTFRSGKLTNVLAVKLYGNTVPALGGGNRSGGLRQFDKWRAVAKWQRPNIPTGWRYTRNVALFRRAKCSAIIGGLKVVNGHNLRTICSLWPWCLLLFGGYKDKRSPT